MISLPSTLRSNLGGLVPAAAAIPVASADAPGGVREQVRSAMAASAAAESAIAQEAAALKAQCSSMTPKSSGKSPMKR